MGIRRLIAALAAFAACGCATDTNECGGTAIDVRPELSDPIRETSMTCTGFLVDLCSQPSVQLDDARCEGPQVVLVPGDGEPWVGLTLTVEAGQVIGAVAATTGGGDSQPVAGGWVQLYAGSLDDPGALSGALEITSFDGASVAGRFSALSNR